MVARNSCSFWASCTPWNPTGKVPENSPLNPKGSRIVSFSQQFTGATLLPGRRRHWVSSWTGRKNGCCSQKPALFRSKLANWNTVLPQKEWISSSNLDYLGICFLVSWRVFFQGDDLLKSWVGSNDHFFSDVWKRPPNGDPRKLRWQKTSHHINKKMYTLET